MSTSSPLRVALSSFAALFVFAGCGGSQDFVSPATSVPAAAAHPQAGPNVKQFGVGLGDAAGAIGNTAGSSQSWRYEYCNGVLENPSGCYSEVPGKRKFTSSASGSAKLQNQYGKPNGSTTAKISATSKLGVGSYSLFGETNELTKYYRNIGAAAQVVSSDWDDTFYVSSGKLKKGSPVTIGVKLTLQNPQTNIACDSAKNSFGELDLYSPSVNPPSGNQFNISGYCVNGTFEYYLYGNAKKTGTTATGTINTAVGDSFLMLFVATGEVIACQTVNYCVGDITASLSGNYKFKVTSITPGATYTTASGNTYK
jgi:hypothetical protein